MSMEMNKIYVLVGLPGVGKSTWLNEFLKDNSNFVVVSSDNILQDICRRNGESYDVGFPKYIKEADQLYKEELQTMLNEGRDIIVDRTNLSVKSRGRVLNKVPDSYIKTVVTFEVEEKEHIRRLNERTDKSIPANILQSMKNSYIEPSFDEKIDVIMTIDIN